MIWNEILNATYLRGTEAELEGSVKTPAQQSTEISYHQHGEGYCISIPPQLILLVFWLLALSSEVISDE